MRRWHFESTWPPCAHQKVTYTVEVQKSSMYHHVIQFVLLIVTADLYSALWMIGSVQQLHHCTLKYTQFRTNGITCREWTVNHTNSQLWQHNRHGHILNSVNVHVHIVYMCKFHTNQANINIAVPPRPHNHTNNHTCTCMPHKLLSSVIWVINNGGTQRGNVTYLGMVVRYLP